MPFYNPHRPRRQRLKHRITPKPARRLPPKRWFSFRKIVVGISLLPFVLAGAMILFYGLRAFWIDLSVIKEMPKASQVYDVRGQQLGRFYEQNRIPLPAGQFPQLLAQAIVATEDQRFWSHWGLDFLGMARATLANLIPGGLREGASTITQQLGRNSIDRLERTYDRKLLEVFLALRIEAFYTKKEILRHYLDRIYFGHRLYGAETASQAFFGKSATDLALNEAALLAGMISAPNRYSPWSAKNQRALDQVLEARNRALRRMVRHDFITEEEAMEAQAQPLALRPRPQFNGSYALEAVRRELEGKLTGEQLLQGGLQIETTIDYGLQDMAQRIVKESLERTEASAPFLSQHDAPPPLQAAFYALDHSTGGIRAVVGGRDFFASPFNRATQARRQVGSTLKPLLYAIAFEEKGYSPASWIGSSPFDLTELDPNFLPTTQSKNYIRINEALSKSNNYAAMRMGYEIGPEVFTYYAQQAGITHSIPPYPSSYLGACDLSLAEMTSVFATLANHGMWNQPFLVREVRNAKGEILYLHTPETRQVFSPQIAAQITHILENAMNHGTGSSLRKRFHFQAPVAGKTGTTNDYKDAWFLGYTSSLTAGVWVGFDHPRPIFSGGYGSRLALPIWAEIFLVAQPYYPSLPFDLPEGLEQRELGGGFFTNTGPRQTVLLQPNQKSHITMGPRESPHPHKDSRPFWKQWFGRSW